MHTKVDGNEVDAVSICGFSIKFPQEATSADTFWEMMVDRRSAMTEFLGAAVGWWLDFSGQLRISPATPVRPRAGPPRRSTPGLSVDWVDAGRDAFFVFLIMIPCRACLVGDSPTKEPHH